MRSQRDYRIRATSISASAEAEGGVMTAYEREVRALLESLEKAKTPGAKDALRKLDIEKIHDCLRKGVRVNDCVLALLVPPPAAESA